MNLSHMKYAVEISETKSINKAADKLFVGQSALSRSIKELEENLGITLFERSAKGMSLTPDGEIFINYAKAILKQVDDVESIFKNGSAVNRQFSISVPRASYISDAFSHFTRLFAEETKIDFIYKETNSGRAIKNILEENYKLGILRYAEQYDSYYKNMMKEKNLAYELITEFRYVLIMSRNSPLATKQNLAFSDLNDYILIAHADPYVPSLSLSQVRKEEVPDNASQRIFVFERGSQFELLASNPRTYMWVSPVPQSVLDRFDLIQKPCADNKRLYKDTLVYKKDYTFSDLDTAFLNQLIESKRKNLG